MLHKHYPARGTPSWLDQWCEIGAGTSRGTLGWHGTLLALYKNGMCVSVYGYHASKRSLGPLLI